MLADPTASATIDGTGWVRDPVDTAPWMKPGQESSETGELQFGGWNWRYDLEATGPAQHTVTLTYDWSAVPSPIRDDIQFPPFGSEHLEHSPEHLADLAERPDHSGVGATSAR